MLDSMTILGQIGAIESQDAISVIPSEEVQTIEVAGKYMNDNITVDAISDDYIGSNVSTQGATTITPSESTQTAVSAETYVTDDITVDAISSTYVGSGITKQAAKTVTPSESSQTAVASGVYTTGAITVGAISKTYVGSGITSRSSSNLSVSSAGLITAPAGYYASAATKQLTTKATTTITPSTASQTACASGVYTTGVIAVAGDSKLVSANILKGKSIFGVSGSNNVLKYMNGSTTTGKTKLTVTATGGSITGYYVDINPGFTPVFAFCISDMWMWRNGGTALNYISVNQGVAGYLSSVSTTTLPFSSTCVRLIGGVSVASAINCWYWIFGY